MKPNEDICHLMVFDAKGGNEIAIKIGEACVKESTEEDLLGVTFDQSLSFNEHAKTLCRKAGKKLHDLALVSCYVDTEKLQHWMRPFVLSHCGYCSLLWMFYDKTRNQRISYVHVRALHIAYKDHRHGFGFLLEQSNSVLMDTV